MMAFTRKFMEKLLEDETYSKKLEQAKTDDEVLAVLTEFASKKGLKVEVV